MNDQNDKDQEELEKMLCEIKQLLKKYEIDVKDMKTEVAIKKSNDNKSNSLLIRISDISDIEFYFKQ